jgi:restriction endonuclease BglII
VDDIEHAAPTHKVDCYKNRVALEVEWNNKDPFFDRDLNNFRLLFELRAIDVGVIITDAASFNRYSSNSVVEQVTGLQPRTWPGFCRGLKAEAAAAVPLWCLASGKRPI